MLIRSFTRNIKQQNWFAVSLDVLVVIVGLFLGLQLNDWRGSQQDSVKELTYLKLLEADLTKIQANIKFQQLFEIERAKDADTLFQIIKNQQQNEQQTNVGFLLTNLAGRRTLNIDSAVFSDLKSSGNLGLITSQSLREKIISYFSTVSHLTKVLEKNNNYFVDQKFTQFVIENGLNYYFESDLSEIVEESLPFSTYQAFLQQHFHQDMLKPREDIFLPQIEKHVWVALERQLSWRAMTAANNYSVAQQIDVMTSDMKKAIQQGSHAQ